MTKEDLLEIIMLLSAVESWSLCDRNKSMPDYLAERLSNVINRVREELLK